MSVQKDQIEAFFHNRTFALFGLSARPKSISLDVYDLMTKKGYQVFPVNPNSTKVRDIECYANVGEIPVKPEAAIIVTKPEISKVIANDCFALGIKDLWFQLQTMDDSLKSWCEENDINWINSCVLLHHKEARFPHSLHRFFHRLFGMRR